MPFRTSYSAACLAILVLTGFSISSIADDSSGERAVAGALKFAIPATEIPDLEQKAVQGDGEAALKLSKHYIFIAFDKGKHDYWLQIAAENGSVLAMYNYAQWLRQGNKLDTLRARYWFEKVVQLGPSPLADEAKKRLGDAW
jgi:TPR repeat protein